MNDEYKGDLIKNANYAKSSNLLSAIASLRRNFVGLYHKISGLGISYIFWFAFYLPFEEGTGWRINKRTLDRSAGKQQKFVVEFYYDSF